MSFFIGLLIVFFLLIIGYGILGIEKELKHIRKLKEYELNVKADELPD